MMTGHVTAEMIRDLAARPGTALVVEADPTDPFTYVARVVDRHDVTNEQHVVYRTDWSEPAADGLSGPVRVEIDSDEMGRLMRQRHGYHDPAEGFVPHVDLWALLTFDLWKRQGIDNR